MTNVKVGKYYMFTYNSPKYVKLIYCKILEKTKSSFYIRGFSIDHEDRFFKHNYSLIPLINRDRNIKEITEEEFERATMLEMI